MLLINPPKAIEIGSLAGITPIPSNMNFENIDLNGY